MKIPVMKLGYKEKTNWVSLKLPNDGGIALILEYNLDELLEDVRLELEKKNETQTTNSK